MQSLTQASSFAASPVAPAAGAAALPAAGAAGAAPAGAAVLGAAGCDFGAAEPLGCTCWAIAAGIANPKASAQTPAHSISRAAQRLSTFDRTLDQTITTFPLLAGRFQSATGR